MRRTRILVVEMPRMLGDIVENIVASEPDMEIVGALGECRAVVATVAETEADVVVLGLSGLELPGEYATLFGVRPQIRLLGVSGDGRHAFLYELRPHRTPLGEVSPQGLVDAIRTAVRAEAG